MIGVTGPNNRPANPITPNVPASINKLIPISVSDIDPSCCITGNNTDRANATTVNAAAPATAPLIAFTAIAIAANDPANNIKLIAIAGIPLPPKVVKVCIRTANAPTIIAIIARDNIACGPISPVLLIIYIAPAKLSNTNDKAAEATKAFSVGINDIAINKPPSNVTITVITINDPIAPCTCLD